MKCPFDYPDYDCPYDDDPDLNCEIVRFLGVTENCFFCFAPTCEGCPDQFSTFEREVKE